MRGDLDETAAASAGAMTVEVDAVYTWVDGDDPAHRAKRARYRPATGGKDATPERWRDNGELRYSLRSLHLHAPWIRRIFIVTDGQVPAWLDTSHPQIEIVDHTQIFPDRRLLPSFNSCVIEAFLHRIPGLASHYLYLNDDVFLGQAVTQADFLTRSGRQILHIENYPELRLRDLLLGRLDRHAKLLAYCRLLLRWSLGPRARLAYVPHTPQLFVKSDVEAVIDRFARPIALGLHQRFRGLRMPLLRVLYVNLLLNAGDPATRPLGRMFRGNEYRHIMLRDNGGGENGLRAMAAAPPKFFCINDDRRNPASQPRLAVMLAMSLRQCFPNPSPFERVRSQT